MTTFDEILRKEQAGEAGYVLGGSKTTEESSALPPHYVRRTAKRDEFNQKLIDKAQYWKEVMSRTPSRKAALHFTRILQRIASYEHIGKFKGVKKRAIRNQS